MGIIPGTPVRIAGNRQPLDEFDGVRASGPEGSPGYEVGLAARAIWKLNEEESDDYRREYSENAGRR